MTRALVLPRFRGKKPEELAELLERLVEELEAELATLRNQATGAWSVSPLVIGSVSGQVTDLDWQTSHLCDSSDGNISVRLPYGRTANLGQCVAINKTSASNTVTAYPAGGQYVLGAASLGLTTERIRIVMWCGEGSKRGWRLVG